VKVRVFLVVMIVLNLVVLLGQIWPTGAPAFARVVNIVFLSATLLFFASRLRKSN
jgi:hypothetical protein